MLDILDARLREDGVLTFSLTGDTDKEARMDMVKRFNAGEAQVFLISLKAGGTGLNLTGADVVIHYDPWWNTSAQNQATDRAYRIGQKRGVQVIKLIAGDTIEARILKLQESKMELSDGVLAGGENLYSIDAQELKKLLR
jgi:SNF2 family DNA or RNA helicase